MKVDGERLRFVLSAGRTGTAFLREYFKQRGGKLHIAYEPATSRRCWMLWNMEQAGLLPGGIASRIALRRRVRDARDTADGHIRLEINSFMSPFVSPLCARSDALHIVHMVRHPFTWIPSMGNFKAAYWRRHIIDYVPFTHVVHPLARDDWSKLPEVLRLAWRWRLANEGIGTAERDGVRYLRVRYEDIVAGDSDLRSRTMGELLHVIDPAYDGLPPAANWSEKVNARPAGVVPEWQDWDASLRAEVGAVCGQLMTHYGYALTP